MTQPQFVPTDQRMTRARLYIGLRCVLHPALVVPLRVMFRDYQAWCREAPDMPSPHPADLKMVLEEAPWARVVGPRGRGLIRVVVHGVGLRKNDGSS